jgi:hypothetical protein
VFQDTVQKDSLFGGHWTDTVEQSLRESRLKTFLLLNLYYGKNVRGVKICGIRLLEVVEKPHP